MRKPDEQMEIEMGPRWTLNVRITEDGTLEFDHGGDECLYLTAEELRSVLKWYDEGGKQEDKMIKSIEDIKAQIKACDTKRQALQEELHCREIQEDRKVYNCSCIALGRDIGVENCGQLGDENRDLVGSGKNGLIGKSLLVLVNCRNCGGTGKLNQ